jgi:hypothetical protein
MTYNPNNQLFLSYKTDLYNKSQVSPLGIPTEQHIVLQTDQRSNENLVAIVNTHAPQGNIFENTVSRAYIDAGRNESHDSHGQNVTQAV